MKSRLARLLVPVVSLVISACSFLPPPAAAPKKAVIEKVPSDLPQRPTTPKTVLVNVPEADAIYDTTKMMYTAKPYELGSFAEYEWAEKPAQMIQPLLVSALQGTKYFKEVVVPPDFSASAYDYVLSSRVLSMLQDYTVKPPLFRAAMHLQLVDTRSGRAIAAQDISTEEPIRGSGPRGGVVAANSAVGRLLRDIAIFVIESADQGAR